MRGVVSFVAAALAALAVSACGSSQVTPASAPDRANRGAGDIVFIAGQPSHALGVDNTDLVAATPSGGLRNLTSTDAAESNAAWSADGSHVVFARESTTGRRNGGVSVHAGLFVWAPGHGAPERIASCKTYCWQHEFTWSPDDRQIAFVSEHGALEVMNADGSRVHTVCGGTRCGSGPDGPVWSPDGKKLLFFDSGPGMGPIDLPSSIWVANADGSKVTRLTQRNCTTFADERHHACARDTSATWSPDGRLIAFSRFRLRPYGPGTAAAKHSGLTTSLEVMNADGSHLHSIYDCHGGNWCDQALQAAWAPDGRALAYAPTVSRQPASLRITSLAGTTRTIPACAGSRCLSPSEIAWSPNGEQLTFLAGGSVSTPDVWVIDRNGSALHRIATNVQWGNLAWIGHLSVSGATVQTVAAMGHPRLSGSIAYAAPSSSGVDYRLGVLSVATARRHELPIDSSMVVEPAWSPDGREIAFGSAGAMNTNIHVAKRNGTNVRALTRFRFGATQPAWSPDGRTLAFESSGRIQLVSAAGGDVRTLATGGQYPSWSPSGSKLVFERSVGRAGGIALFTIRPDGHGLKRLTNLPGEQNTPAWSPAGREIAFEWGSPGGIGLYLIHPDGTHLRRVTSATLPQARPAWSPDGRYLAVISDEGPFHHARILVIDVATGRVSAVATVPAEASDPSWTAR